VEELVADLQIGPVMESTRDVQLEIMYKKCCQGLSFEHSVLGTYPTVDLFHYTHCCCRM
jgi:hypothetical protein